MAWQFDVFSPLAASNDTTLIFAYTGNIGTGDTIEVRIVGTGLGYDPVTGTFTGTAPNITQLVLFDTSLGPAGTALQTVDIAPADQAALASDLSGFLTEVIDQKAIITPWAFAFDQTSQPVWSPDGTTLTLTGTNGDTLVITGSGFVPDTTLGNVTTIEHFDSTSVLLHHEGAAGDPPISFGLNVVAAVIGDQSGSYGILTGGDNTITQLAQTSDGHQSDLEPGAGSNFVNGSATFGGFVSYENSADAVIIDLSLQTVTHQTALAADTLTNIGGAAGSAFNDFITGSDGNNFLVGGGGDDVFDPLGLTLSPTGLGFDIMVGGAGADTFGVGSGFVNNYIVAYNTENGTLGVNVDIQTGTATDTFGDTDTLNGVHNVVGTNFSDTFHGSTANDVFTVGGGDDTITDVEFADFDILVYSPVQGLNNAFNYTSGITVTYAASGTGQVTSTTGTEVGTDKFERIERVLGTQFADIFTTVASNASGTFFVGMGGNDTFNGGTGVDTVDYSLEFVSGANNGVNVNISAAISPFGGVAAGHAFDASGSTDTLNNIENIIGTQFNDRISGSAGNNILDGGTGYDTLFGGDGNDTLISGQLGNLATSFGFDILVGGAGNDTFDVSGSQAPGLVLVSYNEDTGTGVHINLDATGHTDVIDGITVYAANSGLDGTGGTDTYIGGVSNVIGSHGDDQTWGGALDDTFTPGLGNDFVDGGTGSNTLFYGAVAVLGGDLTGRTSGIVVNFDGAAFGSVLGTGAENGEIDTFQNIQSVVGSQFNDTFTGVAGQSLTFIGMGGDDTFNGFIDNNGHFDTVDYSLDFVSGGANDIIVDLAGGVATDAMNGHDTLNNINGAIGGAGTDTLNGNANANFLDGRGNADFMTGFDGNDTYVVDNANDVVTEGSGINSGSDTVISSIDISASDAVTALYADVENLVLATPVLRGTGNDLNNTITGNLLDNILDGGLGNDHLIGGLGTDAMTGGDGNDTYEVDSVSDAVNETNALAAGGIDTINTTVQLAGPLAANVENLTLLGSVLTGTGNALANVITGNGSANTLDGGTGGIDTLAGGTGDDTYIVMTGDLITELAGAANGAADKAKASQSYVLNAGAAVEFLETTNAALATAISLTGNAFAQTITGNAGANTIDGGGLGDTMRGLGGADIYVVDNIGDVVDELVAGSGGIDHVKSSVNFSLAEAVHAKGAIENLTLLAGAATTATGNTLANTIAGNANANTLDGGIETVAAADTLIGGAGNDTYIIRSTTDIITEAAGALNGVADRAQVTLLAGQTYVLTAGAGVEFLETTNAALTTAFNLTGNALAQQITGNAGVNTLDGGVETVAALDKLIGGAGNDTYIIRSSNDVIVEAFAAVNAVTNADHAKVTVSYALAAGVNVEFLETLTPTVATAINLTGNEIAQKITGNAGNNIITGAGGRDDMFGGGGADTFKFTSVLDTTKVAATRDVISDFTHNNALALSDRIDLSAIDANGVLAGTTAFTFLAVKAAAFTGVAGQLHYLASGTNTILEGDINGDKIADFQIELTGIKTLVGGFDIIL
jgi:trimeric autotransporter adhesin